MLASTSNSTLKHLSEYSLEEANQFITSPEWTRAVFIQDPKERFLSAYLNLAKASEGEYLRGVARKQYAVCCLYGETMDQCTQRVASNPHKFIGAMDKGCNDPHWTLQSDRMEPKYWDRINFWGSTQSIQEDAQRLLETIGAWEKFGQVVRFERESMQELVDKWIRYNLEVKILNYYEKDYDRFGFNKTIVNEPQYELSKEGMSLVEQAAIAGTVHSSEELVQEQ